MLVVKAVVGVLIALWLIGGHPVIDGIQASSREEGNPGILVTVLFMVSQNPLAALPAQGSKIWQQSALQPLLEQGVVGTVQSYYNCFSCHDAFS
jgi:hypothetical protein